jgi:hypothetical protein
MRICDNCSKLIPLGSTNHIHVLLDAKTAKIVGNSELDFCSGPCFENYTFKKVCEER